MTGCFAQEVLKSIQGSEKDFSRAKAQRRKENLLETRQRFASLRLCAFAREIFFA
jgi:hypothetical protein